MITFTCCIGDCKHILKLSPHNITNHIQKYHPQAYQQLNSKSIYYCGVCDTFTSYIHNHCTNCELYFKLTTDLQHHYSLNHKFWFLENECIYGQDCKKEICKYNHYTYEKKYFVESIDFIPDSICKFDVPWIDIRCTNSKCNMDHFIGLNK
jgi:hypothetical protein